LSQESQIIECESALKIKNDEVKELKTEKEALNERLEVHDMYACFYCPLLLYANC
jgi:ubiquinone biosynthesis protein UbiJ